MTRPLLPWVALAVLQLTAPATAAAVLPPGGETTSVAPRPEMPWRGALERVRAGSDVVQVAHVTPFVAARSPWTPRALAHDAQPTPTPSQPRPASIPHVLPDARAPPA